MPADTYIAHPLRDDPAAESDDAPNPDCPDCGRKMIVCWPSNLVCLTCNARNAAELVLIEKFNAIFGNHIYGGRVGMLDDRARYAAIFNSAELAKEICAHIEFYAPKTISAASKPLTAKPETVFPAGGGK